MKRVQNANGRGKVFYGLHFVPGVAEYRDKDGPYRVYLNSETTKRMDKSFEGRPLFILHVDEVEDDIETLKRDADGFVVKSFYNAADGKHWCEFLVLSDEAEELIREGGYRLSNSYYVTHKGPPGTWNGVKYRFEVTAAEYEHLALVPDPRYGESIILTPDEFKNYNEQKLADVPRILNSKKGSTGMKLTFFKREKVKNSEEYANIMVALPKSGKQYSILQLVNKADEAEEGSDEPRVVNSSDLIEFDGETITIGKFMKMHNELLKKLENKDDEDEDEKDNEDDEDDDDMEEFDNDDEEQDIEVVKKTEKAEKEKAINKKKNKKANKKKNSYTEDDIEEEVERRMKKLSKADRLRNARDFFEDDDESGVEIGTDMIQRGISRYGSPEPKQSKD